METIDISIIILTKNAGANFKPLLELNSCEKKDYFIHKFSVSNWKNNRYIISSLGKGIINLPPLSKNALSLS